ncbi:phage shock protein PspC (stress-responsive transcriptional regulator) [Leucobacter exalbidus]|uniref:Phage shock protein PspC (Stress-responsive transcriptional regulator) n=1 Tax=Leucobacter exalbidus TaxID=662960 RepID=A0A940T333_9MICO|nr:PspC domain-containing protein [Leucobacter exalbidus]MBP1325413.1 phage shock protein PspC (stress-responsive transcriptional regulator) [Leucobacter exalbidus]
MNTTPDPTPATGMPPLGKFFEWIRGLGIARSDDRWFAGVAGGLAAKANIDPLIVRGLFVVVAVFGTPAIVLYLLGWLVFPDSTGRMHIEEIVRGRAQTAVVTTAAVIAGLVIIPILFGLSFSPVFPMWGWDQVGVLGLPDWLMVTLGWIVRVAVIVIAVVWIRKLVMRHRVPAPPAAARPAPASAEPTAHTAPAAHTEPTTPRGAAQADPDPSSSTSDSHQTSDPNPSFAQQADDWGTRFAEKAETWGQGVSEQAQALSEKHAQQLETQHAARKLGAAHTLISLAIALLAGGIVALLLTTEPLRAIEVTGTALPANALGGMIAALAALAISLIVAGIRGKHTGWVGFLATCGVVALLIGAVFPIGTQYQIVGNMNMTGAQAPAGVLVAGNSYLDLSDLGTQPSDTRARNAQTRDESITIWQVAGNSTVTLPRDHATTVTVYVLAGNVTDASDTQNHTLAGPFLRKQVITNSATSSHTTSANSSTNTATTEVSVYLIAGNVQVENATGKSER